MVQRSRCGRFTVEIDDKYFEKCTDSKLNTAVIKLRTEIENVCLLDVSRIIIDYTFPGCCCEVIHSDYRYLDIYLEIKKSNMKTVNYVFYEVIRHHSTDHVLPALAEHIKL